MVCACARRARVYSPLHLTLASPPAIARNPPHYPEEQRCLFNYTGLLFRAVHMQRRKNWWRFICFYSRARQRRLWRGLELKAFWLKSGASCHCSTGFLISARGATHHAEIGILRHNECFEHLGCCLLQSTLGTQPTVLNEFAQTVSVVLIRDFLIVFLCTSATVSPGAE